MWFFEAVIWSHDQGLQYEIVGDLPGVHNLCFAFAESYTKNFLQFVFYDYVNSLLMHFNICTWFVSGGYNVGCLGCLLIRYFPYLDNVTLWYMNKKKSTIILYKNYYWTECCFSFVQEKCFMHIIMVHYNVYIF